VGIYPRVILYIHIKQTRLLL